VDFFPNALQLHGEVVSLICYAREVVWKIIINTGRETQASYSKIDVVKAEGISGTRTKYPGRVGYVCESGVPKPVLVPPPGST
jgi:hypothetical protein